MAFSIEIPSEIKQLISEYEGRTFQISKGSSFFIFDGLALQYHKPTTIIPLNLKAGSWHILQGPVRYSILETGDLDLALVPTYTLLFYHHSFDVNTLPISIPLSVERGPPYADPESPDEIKSEIFSGQEVALTICSNQEVKLHIKLNDAQPTEEDVNYSITHSVDTPYGVKEGNLYTVIAFPIIVTESQFVREVDDKIHQFLRRILTIEVEEKTRIHFKIEGKANICIDNPTTKTFRLLGLSVDEESKAPFRCIVIDKKGVMGITQGQGAEYHFSIIQPNMVLQELMDFSQKLSNGLYLRTYISKPHIKVNLDKAIAEGKF